MSQAQYEIRVRGEVPPTLLEDFGVRSSGPDGVGLTTVRTDLVDQAALHGLIQALRQAGASLVDVQRLPAAG
jgi:hypothetical protein